MESEKKISPEDLKRFLEGKLGAPVQIQFFPHAQQAQQDTPGEETRRGAALEFNLKPSEIKRHLDRFVIRQDEAKKVLATAICDHYHHIRTLESEDWWDYKKQNIILIGPTGVGKTYLIQNIARLIGVPFVKADATKFSETGYVGGDVEDLVRELVAQADGDVALAECGIIYLDEIDKIASPTNLIGRDVSGHGVQRNLLKLMEETEVPLRSAHDIASQMQALMEFQTKGKIDKKTINTRHILFIVSGAFSGLPEIIRKRLGSRRIGFTGAKAGVDEEQQLFARVRPVDFIEFGFEAEFAGRLPVIVHCQSLSVDDLYDIAKHSEGSILKQYRRDFQAYDIDVLFTDGGMRAIAELAAEEKTGARGLMSVCEKVFREYKYRLPDSKVREFLVTEELVRNPEGTLQELLEHPGIYSPEIRKWRIAKVEKEIFDEYGIRVSFQPDAVEALFEAAEKSGQPVLDAARAIFKSYEHALKLLSKVSKDREFTVDAGAIRDPGVTFEEWIRESYR